MVNVSLRQKLVVLHKFEIKKNPVVNPAKISFFFWKKCGFVHRKILDEKVKKNEVQKKMHFLRQKFLETPRRPILL